MTRVEKEKDENIKVLVRIRPPSGNELSSSSGYHKAVFATEDGRGAYLSGVGVESVLNGQQIKNFSYDSVVDEDTSQEKVFDLVGKPIADAFLKGYHSNLLAYGQTGAGKTYTMQGPAELGQSTLDGGKDKDKEELGLLPRVLEYVFSDLEKKKEKSEEAGSNYSYAARVSYLEIYNEVIFDLLDQSQDKAITVREDGKRGVKIDGAAVEKVMNAGEAFSLFKTGSQSRHTGSTAANRESSRSHSVFILSVEQKFLEESTGLEKRINASFYLVDLAGSERQKHSEAVGQTLKEACGINKSLSTLGNVIKSLVDIADGKERHIPYRDSKLTFILKNSFGGMSKCSFVANVSPSLAALEETLSTLKFAQRAKIVKNTSSVCEETIGSTAALQTELKRVKAELLRLQQEGPQMSFGNVVQNLDGETKDHLEQVRKLLICERAQQSEEREKLTENVESLQGLARKLETSLKSTKLVVRLREQNLQRLQSKLPPVPEDFWKEEGGAAIKENEQLKLQLECHPEIVKCRMEIESLQKENEKLKKKLQTDVESQIFVFEENAKTAMEELHYLLKDREALQSKHESLNQQYNHLKKENFVHLQDAHERLETALTSNENLQQDKSSLEKEQDNLKAEIASLTTSLANASNTIEKSQKALDVLQAEILNHSELCEQLNNQVKTLNENYDSMQEQKQNVEASFKTLKSDMESQKQMHAEECEQLNNQVKTLNENYDSMQEQKQNVEANFKTLKSDMESQKQMHAEECEQLNNQVKTLHENYDSMQEQKQNVEASFETLKSDMESQKQMHAEECEQLNNQVKTLNENYDSMQEQKQNVEANFKTLKSDMESQKQMHAEECEQLNNQVKTLNENYDSMQEQKQNVEANFKTLKSDMESQKQMHAEECEQLNNQVKTLNENYDSMQEQKQNVEANFETLKSDMESQKQMHAEECEQLNNQVKTLNENYDSMQEQKQNVEANFKTLKSDMESQKQMHAEECEQLNNQVKTLNENYDSMQEQKQNVEANFETLKSDMESQKQMHAEECEQLNNQVKTLNENYDSMQEQKQNVEANFETLKSDMESQKQMHAEECDNLRQKLEDITNKLSSKNAERDEFEDRMLELSKTHEAEMDGAKDKIRELESIVEKMTLKAAEIESEEAAYAENLNNLKKELSAKQELLAESEESRMKDEADRSKLEQSVNQLEKKCENLQNEISVINEANASDMEDLQNDLSCATAKYEEVLAENSNLQSSVKSMEDSKEKLEASLLSEIKNLESMVDDLTREKQKAESSLQKVEEQVALHQQNAMTSEKYKTKINDLELKLAKAQEYETELKLKNRESLSKEGTAMAELEKLSEERNVLKMAEEELQLKLSSVNDEMIRYRQLYNESQKERKTIEEEKDDLLSQVDLEAEKRQSAIMAKVHSESKLSEVREEAAELRSELQEQLKAEKARVMQLQSKVQDLESKLPTSRSQSPLTPPSNDENSKPTSFMGLNSLGKSAQKRRPFGEISNKMSIELTPTNSTKSKAADKTKQLTQVKAHLSAIENAITSRSSSRYALRTRNRVTYKE